MAISKIGNSGMSSGAALSNLGSSQLADANMAPGSIIQVVQGTNNVRTSTTSQTLTNTNLTASITPISSSSRILVIGQTQLYAPNLQSAMCGIGIKRGSTVVWVPAADPGTPLKYYTSYVNTAVSGIFIVPFVYTDSPATTSPTTYTIAINSYNGSSQVEDCPGDTRSTGVITLMEIAG